MSFLHVLELGGVPKILPGRLGLEDVISFAEPEEEGSFYNSISTIMWFLLKLIIICSAVIRAISEAISVAKMKKHDPFQAHERVKIFYSWEDVTSRMEKV